MYHLNTLYSGNQDEAIRFNTYKEEYSVLYFSTKMLVKRNNTDVEIFLAFQLCNLCILSQWKLEMIGSYSFLAKNALSFN